ncbi:hypothetical protein BJ508DRAFT_315499 [Ascobolus immersus RN42]|uniref:Uncharacterized protein n=1 Tax=Ascobolus immersus RN42 TaxID=1160509 RepID=A0A3N4HAI5_ASCIM|nr:hypothetical protein BJ508DRAFT_315499 [Ascobolus immersus RN42]
MRSKIAAIVRFLETAEGLPEDVRSDIEQNIGVFRSKSDERRFLQDVKDRMDPTGASKRKSNAATRNARAERRKERQREDVEVIRKYLGHRAAQVIDSIDDGGADTDDSDAENPDVDCDNVHLKNTYNISPRSVPMDDSATPIKPAYLIGQFKPSTSQDGEEVGPDLNTLALLEIYLEIPDLVGAMRDWLIRSNHWAKSLQREQLEDLIASGHPTLVIPRPAFQKPGLVDYDYIIRCTANRLWRSTERPRRDFVAFRDVPQAFGKCGEISFRSYQTDRVCGTLGGTGGQEDFQSALDDREIDSCASRIHNPRRFGCSHSP